MPLQTTLRNRQRDDGARVKEGFHRPTCERCHAEVRLDQLRVPDLVEKVFRWQGTQGGFRQLQNHVVFLVADDSLRDEMKAKILEGIPLGRLGEANDVAGIYTFLASDLSAYVTGAVIDVNGGMLIH